MKRIINLKKLDIQYWLDELPEMNFKSDFTYTCKVTNSTILKSDKKIIIALEMFFHQDISNYALLGVEFTPSDDGTTEFWIEYTEKNTERYVSTLQSAEWSDYRFKGIEKFYLPGMENAIAKKAEKEMLPSGRVHFLVAANCEVGSSIKIFEMLTLMLIDFICYSSKNQHGTEQDILLKCIEKYTKHR